MTGIDIVTTRVPGGKLTHAPRFSAKEHSARPQKSDEQVLDLNPNYGYTKKSAPGVRIRPPSTRTGKKPDQSEAEIESRIAKALEEQKKSAKKKKKPISVPAPELSKEKSPRPDIIESEVKKEETVPEQKAPETPKPGEQKESAKVSPDRSTCSSFMESFMKAKSTWKSRVEEWNAEHEQDLYELSTMASTVTMTPGRAKPHPSLRPRAEESTLASSGVNYRLVEPQHSGYSFGKSGCRTPTAKTLEPDLSLLNPSFGLVLTHHPTAKFVRKENKPTKQLERVQEQQKELSRLRDMLELTKSVDTAACLRAKLNIPVLRQPLIEDGLDKQQEAILRMHKVRSTLNEATIGGRTDQKREAGSGLLRALVQASRLPVSAGTINQCSTPQVNIKKSAGRAGDTKIEKEKARLPGPVSYSPNDDAMHPAQPTYTIPCAEKPKGRDVDKRPPLDVKETLVRKRAPETHITVPSEEHELQMQRKGLEQEKVGPGKYELTFGLVEPRNDLGKVAFAEEPEKKPAEVPPLTYLVPNYDFDKPGKPVPLYKEPTEVRPPHVPESALHPAHWTFYDAKEPQHEPNLTFASNLEYHKFQLAEEQKAAREALRILSQKVPEVGQYEAKPLKEPVPVDFSKGVSRDPYYTGEALLESIGIERAPSLLLNPEKPKPHLPDIRMDRTVPR